MRKCGDCKHRYFSYWDGIECCIDYEMATNEEEEIKNATECKRFEEGTPSCLEEKEPYRPSASNGDYSPSHPWDAPGMSIRNFI